MSYSEKFLASSIRGLDVLESAHRVNRSPFNDFYSTAAFLLLPLLLNNI